MLHVYDGSQPPALGDEEQSRIAGLLCLNPLTLAVSILTAVSTVSVRHFETCAGRNPHRSDSGTVWSRESLRNPTNGQMNERVCSGSEPNCVQESGAGLGSRLTLTGTRHRDSTKLRGRMTR